MTTPCVDSAAITPASLAPSKRSKSAARSPKDRPRSSRSIVNLGLLLGSAGLGGLAIIAWLLMVF